MKSIERRLSIVAAIAACGGCADQPSNYQAVQAEILNEQEAARRNEVMCSDCGPPAIGPDGKIIPQG